MKKILFIFFTFTYASLAFSQEILNLSLQEAFNMALQNSKQLQLDSLKLQAMDIKKDQAKGAMIPTLGITSAYSRLSDNIDPFAIEIPGVGSFDIQTNFPNQFVNVASVKQPVFQGLRNINTLKSLDQQIKATNFDIQKDENDIKFMVVQAYYTLYKLQKMDVLLDSNIQQTQARVDDLNKMKNVGLILNNDVMRAEIQKTNLLVNKTDVESGIEVANYNLNILLGLEGFQKISTNLKEEVNENPNEIHSLFSTALNQRPELSAQAFRSKAMDYAIKASKSAYMPIISVAANGQYNNPNMRSFPPKAEFKATWDVGVSLSWNIMQLYTARAIVNESKNQKAQLDLTTEQIKRRYFY
jgi:outer membrane protein